jgi:ribonuclease HI
MKAILGCSRTTPTAALERETALAPPTLRATKQNSANPHKNVDTSGKASHQNVSRKSSEIKQQDTHLQSRISNIYCGFSQTTQSLLRPSSRSYDHHGGTRPTKFASAQIKTRRRNPTTKPHTMATQYASTQTGPVSSSTINGQVNAAAYSPELAETKSQYVGSEAQFNVYAAEITAINMAVDIAKSMSETIKYFTIYTDGQPAIIATTKPVKQAGQSIVAETLKNLESLQVQKSDLKVSIIWIPGHMDIPGNEKADEGAKKAAISTQSGAASFNHNPLKSARNRIIKETTNRNRKKHGRIETIIRDFFSGSQQNKMWKKAPNSTTVSQNEDRSRNWPDYEPVIALSTSIFTNSTSKTPPYANAEAEPLKLSTTTSYYVIDMIRNELHSLKKYVSVECGLKSYWVIPNSSDINWNLSKAPKGMKF